MNVRRGLALVISNSEYIACNPLPSCEKDGFDIEKSLSRLDFDVIIGFNLSRSELYKKLHEFITIADSYSTVLLYYSGHGIQVDGENYFVPVDCIPINNKAMLINLGLVALNMIADYMNNHPEKTNIIILDACRTSPAFSKNAFSGGLAELKAGSGTFVSFATAPNTVALGASSSSKNSVFTECLLNHIEKPNLKIEDLFKLVRIDVEQKSGGTQRPWESTSLKSDFYFNIMAEAEVNEKIYQFMRNDYSANTLIHLSQYFRKPISVVYRIYLHQKSEKPGGISFSDKEDLEAYVLHSLLEFGFVNRNYRWFYNNKLVIMGEFYHNPIDIALEPIKGQEIVVSFDINNPECTTSGCSINGTTNLPVETNLIITLENHNLDYKAQSKSEVNVNHEFSSEPFTYRNKCIPNGEYKIIISMPISSVQPKSVQRLIGYNGQNLIGENVRIDIVFGKTVSFSKIVAIGNC